MKNKILLTLAGLILIPTIVFGQSLSKATGPLASRGVGGLGGYDVSTGEWDFIPFSGVDDTSTTEGHIWYDGSNFKGYNGSSEVTLDVAATSGGGWTRTGTDVHLTTASDLVGIGTSSPNAPLDVRASTDNSTESLAEFFEASGATLGGTLIGLSGGNAYVDLASTGGGTKIHLASNNADVTYFDAGNVGIGTTSPEADLHIVNDSTDPILRVTDESSAGATAGGRLYLEMDDTSSAVEDGDRLGLVLFRGAEDGASTKSTGAYIAGHADADWGAATNDGRLVFHTYKGTSNEERMRIDSSGNVGIGTTEPLSLFHMQGATPTFIIKDTTGHSSPDWKGTTLSDIDFHTGDLSGGGEGAVARIRVLSSTDASTAPQGELAFWTGQTSGGISEAMRIDSSGNVGIGDDAAGYTIGGQVPALQVQGTDVGSSRIGVGRYTGGVGAGGFYFFKSRASSIGSFATVDDGDQIGNINFFGDDGTDANTEAGLIQVVVNGTPATGDIPTDMVFYTADGGSNQEHMRIDSSGNVGIGEADPSTKIHITDSAFADITFETTSYTGLCRVQESTGEFQISMSGTGDDDFVIEADGDIYLIKGTTSNVGIGTSTWNGSAVGTLAIADGTAPAAGTASQASIYCVSGEMTVMDSAGNTTTISPHNSENNEWWFNSRNVNTGRTVQVDMERFFRDFDEKNGTDYFREFTNN